MIRISPFLLASTVLLAASSLSKDEKALQEAQESCQHWAGEEPYDPARGKEINDGIKRDCGAALKLAEKVERQSHHSAIAAGLILRIVDIAPMGETTLGHWKKKVPALCKEAESYFATKEIKADPDAQSTASIFCHQSEDRVKSK